MFKKIFASAFIIFYIFCLPLYSYSSTLTFNQFMKLTSSGVAKVAPRAATIGLGVWAARGLLGLSGVGLVVTVALGVHDLYNLYKEVTVVNVPVRAVTSPVVPGSAPPGAIGKTNIWGTQGTPGSEYVTYISKHISESPFTCVSGYGAPIQVTNYYLPDNVYAVGGFTAISSLQCSDTVKWTFSETTYVYGASFPASVPLPVGVPSVDLTEGTSTYPIAGREQVQEQLALAQAVAESAIVSNPANAAPYKSLLTQILAAQNALQSVPLAGGDYTIAGTAPVENTFPEGTNPDDISFPSTPPAENPPTEEPPSGDVPPIPNDACSYYQRAKHFDYSSLLQSAQAIPLLGLLSKLVINPAAGQFNGKVNFQLSKFGAQEIDLNKWHYSDAIAIFRFVIIGGAFLTAIRIIYD